MASASSMEPSLLKKTPKSLDLSLPLYQAASSSATCSPSTPLPSCSYVHPDLQKASLSRPSAQRLLSIESLNEQLHFLLKLKLAYQILNGHPQDTMQFHKRALLQELTNCIGLSEEPDVTFRNELLTLLTSSSKHQCKEIPTKDADWIKLLTQWIRQNSSDGIVWSREIYKVLAVDGFRGWGIKDLKHYLSGVLLPLRAEYNTHVLGVKSMYEFFEENQDVICLTGTDSACVVFLALIKCYSYHLNVVDDQIAFKVERAKTAAEGFLWQRGSNYHDVKNVNEQVLEALGDVYVQQFRNKEMLKIIAEDMVKRLKYSI